MRKKKETYGWRYSLVSGHWDTNKNPVVSPLLACPACLCFISPRHVPSTELRTLHASFT